MPRRIAGESAVIDGDVEDACEYSERLKGDSALARSVQRPFDDEHRAPLDRYSCLMSAET